MNRSLFLRCITFGLAFVHTFPARRHLGAFFAHPSLDEAWKGFGALLAIGLYLLPVRVQARGLAALWRERRVALGIGGFVLAVAHVVPAYDHLPKFVASPNWGDAWRGFGATFAALWFVLPLPAQARALTWLARRAAVIPRITPDRMDRALRGHPIVRTPSG